MRTLIIATAFVAIATSASAQCDQSCWNRMQNQQFQMQQQERQFQHDQMMLYNQRNQQSQQSYQPPAFYQRY